MCDGERQINAPWSSQSEFPVTSRANISADTSRVDWVRHALITWGRNEPVVQVAGVRPTRVEIGAIFQFASMNRVAIDRVLD
jgi:hypothetical protein